MKDRIKTIRKNAQLSQTKFGERLGVTLSAVQKWEMGLNVPDASSIKVICDRFSIREEWLRTGEGEMEADGSRALEVQAQVERLFADDGARFQQALISALLQFDPDGPQWRVVEEIFSSVVAQIGPVNPGADRAALHAELDRQLDAEKKDTAGSSA